QPGQLGPQAAIAVDPADDLPGPGEPGPRAARAGLGRRPRPADLCPRRQRPVEGRAGAQPEEAVAMNENTIETVAPIEVATKQSTPTTNRETVFDVRSVSVLYGSSVAVKDVDLEIY